MEAEHTFDSITAGIFEDLLKQYADVVSPDLAELEHQRLQIIPDKLQERDVPYLTKDELATLMDWKLAHGKFRPMLKALIQRNTDADVELRTREGFEAHDHHQKILGGSVSNISAPPPLPKHKAREPILTLSQLTGVGPATASLLLSTYDPEKAPFFSDELFRWAMWEEGKGKGWDRKIKYDVKEYQALRSRVREFQTRFEKQIGKQASALDVEKVAYVLGKRAASSEGTGDRTQRSAKKRKGAPPNDAVEQPERAAERDTKDEQNEKTGQKRNTCSASRTDSMKQAPPVKKARRTKK